MISLSQEQIGSFKSFVDAHDYFIIAGHKEPDGDCISSCMGMSFILKHLNKKYTMINSGPFKRSEIKQFANLFSDQKPSLYGKQKPALLIVDCCENERLGDFYIDHPQFIERPWSLPSRCDNTSPVLKGTPGGGHVAFTRLLDKPFAITEYNFSGPGRFRGVGGIMTGCLVALQDWGGVWRFAYSHGNWNMFNPSGAGYFDLASDP
ncbi:MAG: hypothetical protein IKI40_06040, partial [Treponema sp.]|nr:hypothetical protein [Treponema sp.]